MKLPCNCEMGFWNGHCVSCGKALPKERTSPLLIVIACVAVAVAILFALKGCRGVPTPQDTHTGILESTPYDSRNYCDNVDRPNPICDGKRP